MAINTPSTRYFGWRDETTKVKFEVNFPKAPELELVLIGAEYKQDIEQHDRIILYFKGKPFVKGTELKQHDPVNFKFESGKVKRKFSGFVHYVDSENTSKLNNTEVVCVGSSSLLKKPDHATYPNVTADQVVSKVAKKYGMKCISQRHPRKRNIIVQPGDTTDWQLCRRLAKQTGFTLLVDNNTIVFQSKSKIFDSNKKNAPYFYYVDVPQAGIMTKADRNTGTIVRFNATLNDESPETGIAVNRVLSGVHSKTGKAIVSKHPKDKIKVSGASAPNVGETFLL